MIRTVQIIALAATLIPVPADAETLATSDDPEAITEIGPGVAEIDLGALAILTYHDEDGASNSRVNMLLSLGYQYVVYENVSIGGQFLFNRDRTSDVTSSFGFGAALFGTYHARLGFSAFLRPTLALGTMFGNRARGTGTGTVVMETGQVAFLTRLQLPLAFYPSRRIVLEAGPELNISLGSADKSRGQTVGFTTLASGFSIGLGYVF